jgi:hypothetical protein
MNIKIIPTEKGDLSYCRMNDEIINTTSEFLDLMVLCPTDTIVLHKENLPPAFFDLKSGIAGEFLQKTSNYHRKLIILGDYSDYKSESLKAFIYESNKTGLVIFTRDIDQAVKLLK